MAFKLHAAQRACNTHTHTLATASKATAALLTSTGTHLCLLLHLRIVIAAADEALGGVNRVGGVGDCLQVARAAI